MATKASATTAVGGMHTAGIFSNMTVDGPNIGTLVAIIDRAKNLPNRRTMGKQDPYCAARLGKEAKKTSTDKRGGQTPRWDQELRFPVHDSPDYHNLKVSVFNDDKKTELIGETWVSLEAILSPGGGQSDSWHGLNCRGKYAGEIRIELTYYDTRPKPEKAPVEKKKMSGARPDAQSAGLSGPREHTPVKRRPLPSDPTGASPSPVATPEHRGLSGHQSGPRPIGQRRSNQPDSHSTPSRRPLPDASPLNGTPASNPHTPQNSQRTPQQELPNVLSNPARPSFDERQLSKESFDMSYTAPKPYEVQPLDIVQHRATSSDDFRSSQGHAHSQHHIDLPHSYSAPIIPTQHSYEPEPSPRGHYTHQPDDFSSGYHDQQLQQYSHAPDPYEDPQYHIEPLRTSRSNTRMHDQAQPQELYRPSHGYTDSQNSYDSFTTHARPSSAMQPTVEDEDDPPPPPPVHRRDAATLDHEQFTPSYQSDAIAPLNINRFRDESPRPMYDSPPQAYDLEEYHSQQVVERRYTHSRASPQPVSRPVSRDTMAPSPLRQETALIPASLVPGIDASRNENRMVTTSTYQTPPSYETPTRMRHHSEPDYHTPPHYDTPSYQHQLVHRQTMPLAESPNYYPHPPPQEPRHTSPVHDSMPIIKPRAVSPRKSYDYADDRTSRAPVRSMPTRKSVSPRPPPSSFDDGQRRLSGVPFNPDSFDVLNPAASKTNERSAIERRGSHIELNDKGQVVTFSGRVIDASDHLPLDSWAPEPERKGPQKDRPARERPTLNGARDIEDALQREREYRRDRGERDRIRSAVEETLGEPEIPSNALVTTRHYHSSSNGSPMNSGALVLVDRDTPPGSGGRNRLQKHGQRPTSTFIPSNSSPAGYSMSNPNVLRERENPGGYGSSPNYGSAGNRHSIAAPPIPAKIPLDLRRDLNSEDMALSLELQSIDIGPGSARQHRGSARRRYGDY